MAYNQVTLTKMKGKEAENAGARSASAYVQADLALHSP